MTRSAYREAVSAVPSVEASSMTMSSQIPRPGRFQTGRARPDRRLGVAGGHDHGQAERTLGHGRPDRMPIAYGNRLVKTARIELRCRLKYNGRRPYEQEPGNPGTAPGEDLRTERPSPGTVIAGSGPAGMACALGLARRGRASMVVEKDSRCGGLCQTIDYDGFLFDIGGHRFLSRLEEINALWRETLGDELLRVKRLSRIFYRGRFFKYPLSFFDTFKNLGPVESVLCVASYLKDRVSRPADDGTFEGWIINRFGRRLYRIFFDVYTRKVWAIPCKDLSADWAKQRIQGLSLKVAVRKAILGTWAPGPKTLTEEFLYPRRGPG